MFAKFTNKFFLGKNNQNSKLVLLENVKVLDLMNYNITSNYWINWMLGPTSANVIYIMYCF